MSEPASNDDMRRSACRVCGHRDLSLVLDLGSQPLANRFLEHDDLRRPEPRYPLELCRCPRCGHVQLSVTVAPDLMFTEYLYATGTSAALREHFQRYAAGVQQILPESAFVVEIGSNDGTLLQAFDRSKVRLLGVEPARNLAELANGSGVPTLNDFFGAEVAARIVRDHGEADAIIANNVVAHVHDLTGLVHGISTLLASDGVFIAEFPYLIDLLERTEYDTVYHEHLSYFSVTSAAQLFGQFGLSVFDVRRESVHGGSLRIFVARGRSPSSALREMLEMERTQDRGGEAALWSFAGRVAEQRRALIDLLNEQRKRGARLAGYGAAAKGNTLLNYCALQEYVEYVADLSKLKQGLYTPGTHIPVVDPERLSRDRPDFVLMLAWNLEHEILQQQAEYRQQGGHFIVPIPLPRVI